MANKWLAALGVVAITALTTYGCGGTSKTVNTVANTSATTSGTTTSNEAVSTKPGKPLTRSALIARADKVCARVNARRKATTVSSIQTYVQLLPPLAAYEKAAAIEMSALTPPDSMTRDWRVIVAGNKLLAENTAKLAEYAGAKDLGGARPLAAATSVMQQRVASTAHKDGFKDCARFS